MSVANQPNTPFQQENSQLEAMPLPDDDLSIGTPIEIAPALPYANTDLLKEAEPLSDQSKIQNPKSKIEAPLERSIAAAAFIIMMGNILSRVMGLVREQVVAGLYGGSAVTDALTIASNVSTITYDLLISGIVSAALVPVFSEYAAKEKREELWRIASSVLSIATVGLGVVVGGLMLLARPLTSLL